MMRFWMVGSVILLTLLLQWGCSSSRSALDTSDDTFRCYYDNRLQQIGKPVIVADFIQFLGSEKPRVDLYLEVPHSNLYFAVNGQESLETEYVVSIWVNDRQNNVIDRREFTRKVGTTREQLSRYGASDRTLESFNLEPGEYRFVISIHDRAVRTSSQIRKVVQVRSRQPDPVTISDLLLIRSKRHENDRLVINPMLSNRVLTLTEPFNLFAEVYSNGDREEITMRYGLVREIYSNDFLIDNPFSFRVQRPYHRTGVNVEKRDTVVSGDTTLALKPGTNQLFIPFDHENVNPGSYRIFVEKVDTGNEGTVEPLRTETKFMIHSIDFPHMTDVDQQIEALYYIASTRDLNYMEDGETREERRKRLNEFWQSIGAWRMSDYYERVRIANELFTNNIEGWKTPMGMVFIVLGDPHVVNCRIGPERAETWTYYLQTGGMEFTFIRERTADPNDPIAHYWISSIRGGYSAWLSALNTWR